MSATLPRNAAQPSAAPDAGHPAVVEEWFGELVKILLAVPTASAQHRCAVGVSPEI